MYQLEGPWAGVRFGVVDRDFDFHCSVVHPADPLNNLRSICYRAAVAVEPHIVVEARRLHHECVAFPLARGVAFEGWHFNIRQGTSIREYLPVRRVHFIESDEQAGHLHNLP